MKKLVKFFIAFLVGVSLFFFVVKETGIETIWEAISLFWGWEGAVILTVTFLAVFVGALRWREIIASEGEKVPLLLTARYLIKGFTVDFLTPLSLVGGETVRIFLLEKDIGFKKSAFSSIAEKIVDVTVHFSFLVFGALLFIFYGFVIHSTLLLYAGAAILFIFILLALFYERILRKESFLELVLGIVGLSKYLTESENGKTVKEIEEKIILFFSSKKRELAKGMALSFLRHFLLLARVFLVIFFVTGKADFGVAVIAYSLLILSMLLPIPAALGGMEVFLALGFNVLGLGFAAGVVAAIILRGADLIVCSVGIVLFIRLSLKSFVQQFSLFLRRFRQ